VDILDDAAEDGADDPEENGSIDAKYTYQIAEA